MKIIPKIQKLARYFVHTSILRSQSQCESPIKNNLCPANDAIIIETIKSEQNSFVWSKRKVLFALRAQVTF